MTKGLQRSLGRAPSATPVRAVNQIDINIAALPITVNGATGVGFGTLVVADFPEGNIQLEGAVVSVSFLKTTANIIAAWNGDFAVGTTPASDGTLTAGDVDIIPSTALGPASGGAVATTRVTSIDAAQGIIHDNTAGTLELNFNMLIDDLSIDANTQLITLTGDLTVSFSVLGDD